MWPRANDRLRIVAQQQITRGDEVRRSGLRPAIGAPEITITDTTTMLQRFDTAQERAPASALLQPAAASSAPAAVAAIEI